MGIFRPSITYHKPDTLKDKEFKVVLDSGVTSHDVTLAGKNLPIVKELEFKYDAIDITTSNKLLEYMSYYDIYNTLKELSKDGSFYRLDFNLKGNKEDLASRIGLHKVYKNTLQPEISLQEDEIPLTCTLELSTSGVWIDTIDKVEENQWFRTADYSCYTQTLPSEIDFPKDLELPLATKDKFYLRYTYAVWYKDTQTQTMKFKSLYKSKTFEITLDENTSTQSEVENDPVSELKARLAKVDHQDVPSLGRVVDYKFKTIVSQNLNLDDKIQVTGEEGDYKIILDFKLLLNVSSSTDMFISNLEGISITADDPTVIISKDNNNLNINASYGTLEVNNVTLSYPTVKKEIKLKVSYKSTNGNNTESSVTIYPFYNIKKEILVLNPDNLLHGHDEYMKLREDLSPAFEGFYNVFYYNDIPSKTVRSTWEILDNDVVIYTIDNTLIPSTLGIFTHNSFRKGSLVEDIDKGTLKRWSLLFPNVKLEKEELTEDEVEDYLSSEVYTGLPYGKPVFTKNVYRMRVTFYNKDNDILGRVEKDFNLNNFYLKDKTNRSDLYSLNCYKLPFLSMDKNFKFSDRHNGYKICKPINTFLTTSQPLYHEESIVLNMAGMFREKDPENIFNLYAGSPYYYNSNKFKPSDLTFTIFKDLSHLAEMIYSMSFFEDPILGTIRRPIEITLGTKGDYFKPIYLNKVYCSVSSIIEELKTKGILEVIKDPTLERQERYLTISVYPSEKTLSYPLYMETIPYVFEEEIYGKKDTPNEENIFVKGDTKELKIFKDNFDFKGLIHFGECTDCSLTGFKGYFAPMKYYKGQEVIDRETHSLYVCIKDTEVDTIDINNQEYFTKVCVGNRLSGLPKELERRYGKQLPTLTALASYFNLFNVKDTVLSISPEYDLNKRLEMHNKWYSKSKILGKDLLLEGSIEHYGNLLGYWFKFLNLNNHRTIYYSSRPLFWCKDKNTVVKIGLTHPKNNLIRVGLKYYYARLVTDVYNPEDDCCVEPNVISGIPNNDLDFTSFNDPSLENARESLISYSILQELINSTEIKGNESEDTKKILIDGLEELKHKSTKTNLVYSAIPKDKKGNRFLDQEDILAYNIHMEEELDYSGELSEDIFNTSITRTYDKSKVIDTPYKDYYPVHIVLEEVNEEDLPIYNLKTGLQYIAKEYPLDNTINSLKGNPLIPTIFKRTNEVKIPNLTYGGGANDVNLSIEPITNNIHRVNKTSALKIPCYDRWSMTGYLGTFLTKNHKFNPIFSQLEKILKHRVQNNDVLRVFENDKRVLCHIFYNKGIVYLVPTDHPFLAKDDFIKYGRPHPLDSFSKDVLRVKLGNLIFDVELQYLLNSKGV